MTGREGAPDPEGGPLKFYLLAHNSTDAPATLTIGATACIYCFPVAPNVAFAGGRFGGLYASLRKRGAQAGTLVVTGLTQSTTLRHSACHR